MTQAFDPLEEGQDHENLGEPIAELKGLEEEVPSGFLGRVLSALHRRSLVGQMATMAWTASAQALFEFLGMIFSIFEPGDSTEEKEGPPNG